MALSEPHGIWLTREGSREPPLGTAKPPKTLGWREPLFPSMNRHPAPAKSQQPHILQALPAGNNLNNICSPKETCLFSPFLRGLNSTQRGTQQFQFPEAPVDTSTQTSPCWMDWNTHSPSITPHYQHWGSSAPTCHSSSYQRARAVRKDQHHHLKKRVLALYSRECSS